MTLNKPSPRLAILRAQLAAKAEAEQLQRDTMRLMALAPIRCKAPAPDADSLPLPPSYWDDLEHWLKTLAPTKPTSKQTEPAADVWHSEAPSVAGVYIADTQVCIMQNAEGAKRWMRHWDGKAFSAAWQADFRQDIIEDMRAQRRTTSTPIQWLRLIEADAPADRLASTSSADWAALVGAKLTHSVCVKQHGEWGLGEVVNNFTSSFEYQEHWLPCDKDGWIPQNPTADSTCPVPDEVEFEVRKRCGTAPESFKDHNCLRDPLYVTWWRVHDGFESSADLTAWRPIADYHPFQTLVATKDSS